MSIYTRTSLIINENSKQNGVVPYYYRCRNCDTNLTSNAPADQYQRLKLIQKTARVPSSVYTMNLGSLTSGHGPSWNQTSDRSVASVQKSTKTSTRPGGQSPGGAGCDVKHNSYERRLNRLKGKALLKRGPVPANFGNGSTELKTNIVSGAACSTANQDRLYINDNNSKLDNLNYTFAIGQTVYAIRSGETYYSVATITLKYTDTLYQVRFASDSLLQNKPIGELKIYYNCVCDE